MTIFLRLLEDKDKAKGLLTSCTLLRAGATDSRVIQLAPEAFGSVPGAPFAYWLSDSVRTIFETFDTVGADGRTAWVGLQTNNDFQWLRLWWESANTKNQLFALVPHPKGGAFSRFYCDVHLSIRWGDSGHLIAHSTDRGHPFQTMAGSIPR